MTEEEVVNPEWLYLSPFVRHPGNFRAGVQNYKGETPL